MEPTLKNQIMDRCPKEFRADLESFLHVLITKILEIKYKMEITSISKLSDIEEAYEDLDSLADELYFDRHTTECSLENFPSIAILGPKHGKQSFQTDV